MPLHYIYMYVCIYKPMYLSKPVDLSPQHSREAYARAYVR